MQYNTIYNKIQYKIFAIYYNRQWNTKALKYNEKKYDTMDNMIQWTICIV